MFKLKLNKTNLKLNKMTLTGIDLYQLNRAEDAVDQRSNGTFRAV